jgi:hypothetical protein
MYVCSLFMARLRIYVCSLFMARLRMYVCSLLMARLRMLLSIEAAYVWSLLRLRMYGLY